jgi:transcription antitermination factor NusG
VASHSIQWFVVRTNPRCERRAKASLADAGFETYAPTGRRGIIHHRTKKLIVKEYPILVGYIFLVMPADRRLQHFGFVRACDGVHSVLGLQAQVGGAPRYLPIPASVVDKLHDEEFRGSFDDTRQVAAKRKTRAHGFAEDDAVRVTAGPFSDFTATVCDARGQEQIKVLVEIFGRLTEVSVPVDAIEPIRKARTS